MIFNSCERKARPVTLYNIDSLLDNQSRSLSKERARLDKQASFNNDEKSAQSITPDSAGWSNELDMFRKIGLMNKLVGKSSYLVSDKTEPGSNLRVRSFTAAEDLPVKFLKIYYQEDISRIKKIEGLYNEANAMYASSRELTLEFSNVKGKSLLTSYNIRGGQEMIVGDSVTYEIQGTIDIE